MGDKWGGVGVEGVWKRGAEEIIMYLLLLRHLQNASCIKMGSNENHLNVSLIFEGQSHKTLSTKDLQ